MLLDGVRFREATTASSRNGAIQSFIDFLERKLGVTVLYDKRRFLLGRTDLSQVSELAELLMERGILQEFHKAAQTADEPRIKMWWGRIGKDGTKNVGGASWSSDAQALTAALAEGLERSLWYWADDYFEQPRSATAGGIARHGAHIAPDRFAGFSEAQQGADPALRQTPESSYLWVRGHSLVSNKPTYLPAQTVTAAWRPRLVTPREPLIRTQVTTGLATWTTRDGARLRGALECIERDAYMIWWFNQLPLPRVNVQKLSAANPSFAELVARCERYRLRVHILPLATDAPAHAVCVVLEDMSDLKPRFAFGLKARASFIRAAEGAMLEALRARLFTRFGDAAEHYNAEKDVTHIGHRGRVHYWAEPANAAYLEQLLSQDEHDFAEAEWEHDTEDEHLARIVRWCKEKGYEFVSVSMTRSKNNPTNLHVESVVIPELIPTHLTENLRHLGGTRLTSVPSVCNYAPRKTPFIERPHPFC